MRSLAPLRKQTQRKSWLDIRKKDTIQVKDELISHRIRQKQLETKVSSSEVSKSACCVVSGPSTSGS